MRRSPRADVWVRGRRWGSRWAPASRRGSPPVISVFFPRPPSHVQGVEALGVVTRMHDLHLWFLVISLGSCPGPQTHISVSAPPATMLSPTDKAMCPHALPLPPAICIPVGSQLELQSPGTPANSIMPGPIVSDQRHARPRSPFWHHALVKAR